MQAVWYERNGRAEDVLRYGELPLPRPSAGEVRVMVMASAVGQADISARRGPASGGGLGFPFVVPHQDGAGWIDEVGEDVPRSRLGERVWVYMAQWRSPWGTAAQYCLVPQGQAVPLPAGVSFAEGACIGTPAIIAHRMVTACGGVEGKQVLVRGIADPVGFYAVQLARYFGACSVAALVSGEEMATRAIWAGANQTIDQNGGAQLLGEGSYDCNIEPDLAANIEADVRLLRRKGVIVAQGGCDDRAVQVPFQALLAKDAMLCATPVYTLPKGVRLFMLADIRQLLEQRCLKHTIHARRPLADTVLAHQLLEGGKPLGRVLVEPWAA
jgi:NADPH2:quinone reductase